ncbi:S-adenosyl-L-methionine-dependent methyltransferase [Hypoxylon rubiginosum]|uniref:S-adenosyl-L-methionine-dependent methyltransferase n=1 Tax=Hypoxylon rubiginosum TaxID=110542 RepID=A0ACC0D0I8_9PEZI|nr:S-adenosyl-L-methionine-dependent methyltransferase [Hypoxylon rubiginosum]
MATTTTTLAPENVSLAKARGCQSREDCLSLYAQWAATYNVDLADASQNYIAPFLVADMALGFSSHAKGAILDAGCGTGLVGEGLARGGATTIDGLDLSPEMLKMAERTGAYRSLAVGDLTQRIAIANDTYDIVTCVGTFTQGHVGPDPALGEFVRVTKKDGLILATVLGEIWKSGGYEAEVKRLEAEGLIDVISADLKDYRAGRDKANVIILRKR